MASDEPGPAHQHEGCTLEEALDLYNRGLDAIKDFQDTKAAIDKMEAFLDAEQRPHIRRAVVNGFYKLLEDVKEKRRWYGKDYAALATGRIDTCVDRLQNDVDIEIPGWAGASTAGEVFRFVLAKDYVVSNGNVEILDSIKCLASTTVLNLGFLAYLHTLDLSDGAVLRLQELLGTVRVTNAARGAVQALAVRNNTILPVLFDWFGAPQLFRKMKPAANAITIEHSDNLMLVHAAHFPGAFLHYIKAIDGELFLVLKGKHHKDFAGPELSWFGVSRQDVDERLDARLKGACRYGPVLFKVRLGSLRRAFRRIDGRDLVARNLGLRKYGNEQSWVTLVTKDGHFNKGLDPAAGAFHMTKFGHNSGIFDHPEFAFALGEIKVPLDEVTVSFTSHTSDESGNKKCVGSDDVKGRCREYRSSFTLTPQFVKEKVKACVVRNFPKSFADIILDKFERIDGDDEADYDEAKDAEIESGLDLNFEGSTPECGWNPAAAADERSAATAIHEQEQRNTGKRSRDSDDESDESLAKKPKSEA